MTGKQMKKQWENEQQKSEKNGKTQKQNVSENYWKKDRKVITIY